MAQVWSLLQIELVNTVAGRERDSPSLPATVLAPAKVIAMKNVEDIYPLSPVQQGMLFHALYDPKAGMYLEQKTCTLHGQLDVPAFERAWRRVMKGIRSCAQLLCGKDWKSQCRLCARRRRCPGRWKIGANLRRSSGRRGQRLSCKRSRAGHGAIQGSADASGVIPFG